MSTRNNLLRLDNPSDPVREFTFDVSDKRGRWGQVTTKASTERQARVNAMLALIEHAVGGGDQSLDPGFKLLLVSP